MKKASSKAVCTAGPMYASGVMSRASWGSSWEVMGWNGKEDFQFSSSMLLHCLNFIYWKHIFIQKQVFKKQGLGSQVFTIKSGHRKEVKSCHMALICSYRKIRSEVLE